MRLFLAIELPAPVRVALGRWIEQIRPRARGFRFARADTIHLTLRFLGEVDAERERAARQGWGAAVAELPVPVFRLGELGAFPDERRPRVLWIGVVERHPGRLAALATSLESAARAAGFASEERAFRPHLTLARAVRGARPRLPASETGPDPAEVEAGEVVLFESQLEPGGARHVPLERFAVGRAEAEAPAPSERRG